MLYTVALISVILWLLGMVSGFAIGNLIHLLLVVAVVVVLLSVVRGRKPLT